MPGGGALYSRRRLPRARAPRRRLPCAPAGLRAAAPSPPCGLARCGALSSPTPCAAIPRWASEERACANLCTSSPLEIRRRDAIVSKLFSFSYPRHVHTSHLYQSELSCAHALSRTNILHRSLDKHIVPSFEFLRGVLGSDTNVQTAISRDPYMLTYATEIRICQAVETLRRHGFSENATSELLTFNPRTFRLTPSRIGEICKELEALGLPITDSRFARSFCAMSKLKRENWLQKVALYQHFGVSKSELLKAFKKEPTIMKYSNENIKKKFHFFLDELKLEPSDVMKRPKLIGYSLDKSILPRCAVLSMLMRDGKIERLIDLCRPLIYSNKAFLDKYVVRYADKVPDVVKAYEGKIKFKGFRAQDV